MDLASQQRIARWRKTTRESADERHREWKSTVTACGENEEVGHPKRTKQEKERRTSKRNDTTRHGTIRYEIVMEDDVRGAWDQVILSYCFGALELPLLVLFLFFFFLLTTTTKSSLAGVEVEVAARLPLADGKGLLVDGEEACCEDGGGRLSLLLFTFDPADPPPVFDRFNPAPISPPPLLPRVDADEVAVARSPPGFFVTI